MRSLRTFTIWTGRPDVNGRESKLQRLRGSALGVYGRAALMDGVLDGARQGSAEALNLLGCALVLEWMSGREGR